MPPQGSSVGHVEVTPRHCCPSPSPNLLRRPGTKRQRRAQRRTQPGASERAASVASRASGPRDDDDDAQQRAAIISACISGTSVRALARWKQYRGHVSAPRGGPGVARGGGLRVVPAAGLRVRVARPNQLTRHRHNHRPGLVASQTQSRQPLTYPHIRTRTHGRRARKCASALQIDNARAASKPHFFCFFFLKTATRRRQTMVSSCTRWHPALPLPRCACTFCFAAFENSQ